MEQQNTEQSETKNKTKLGVAKRVANIVINVIIYVFFALCIFALILSITAKKDTDGAMSVFGTQMRIVTSSSMEKNEQTYPEIKQYKIKDISVKTMVYIQLVPEDKDKAEEWFASLKVGDVLTFRYYITKQETITHRITDIQPNSKGGFTITLQGDNVLEGVPQIIDTSERETSYNYIIGKVTGTSAFLGNLIYAVKQPVGLALIIIVPCAIIIVWQLIRVFSILNENKKKKAEEIQSQQSSEIEQLKKKLAELEGGGGADSVQPDTPKADTSDEDGFEDELNEPSEEPDVPDGAKGESSVKEE